MSVFTRGRRALPVIAALALSASALAGCSDEAKADIPEVAPGASCDADVVVGESDGVRTINTAFGEVDIPTDPKRIIGLEGGTGPALESGLTPVATGDDYIESYLPGEYDLVKDLPLVLTPDGWDFDKIVSLKPDLMVGFVRGGLEERLSDEKTAEWKKLNAIAPTVLIRSNGSGQTKDVSCAIQVALGHQDEADEAKQAYEDRAAELKEKYADVLAEHTFAAMDAYETVSVYSPISWIGDILTDAGATLVPLATKDPDVNAADISFEELTQVSDATVVLYSETVDGQLDLGAQDLQKAPTYAELPAVKAGHDYGIKYFFADRYSTALEALDSLEEVLEDLAKA